MRRPEKYIEKAPLKEKSLQRIVCREGVFSVAFQADMMRVCCGMVCCSQSRCEEGLGPSLPEPRTPGENTQVGLRVPGLAPAAPLPPPLHHAACTTPVSAPRLHRTCVVDSLTHTQWSILPASAPVLSLRRLSLRRIHAAPPAEPHAFAPCGCTCSYMHHRDVPP